MTRTIVAVLAALLAFTGSISIPTTALAEAHWRHYGADHAYQSKAAAKADAANVFRRAGWPPEAVAAMVEKMRTAPPERIELRKGDRLDFMRSGATGLWRDVVVDFVSPANMNITAPADRWVVVVGGVTYEAILPDVCNNLAGRKSERPPVPCAYLVFRAEDKDKYARVDTLGELTAQEEAECSISWQGPGSGPDGLTFNLDGYRPLQDCPDRPCDWRSAVAFYRLPHHVGGTIPVSAGWYVVRLPLRFAESMDLRAVLCLVDDQNRPTREMGALPSLYVTAPDGSRIYTLYYNEAQIPADYQVLYRQVGADSARWRWVHEERQQYAALR